MRGLSILKPRKVQIVNYHATSGPRMIAQCLFIKGGFLQPVVEMLDEGTLRNVLLNIALFRENVSLLTVKSILMQLFGAKWPLYYDAYCKHALDLISQKNAAMEQNSDNTPAAKTVWGVGYDLSFPRTSSQINGYAVLNALNTLDSMESACKDSDYSFVPGEPSGLDIDTIWTSENNRLLWIRYCSPKADFMYPPHVDGQVILDHKASHTRARVCMASKGASKMEPAAATSEDWGHEIWDIAALPHPRRLWCSFATDPNRPPQTVSSNSDCPQVCPAPYFFRTLITEWAMPTKRPCIMRTTFPLGLRKTELFGTCESHHGVRFVKFDHGVMDMVQLSWIDFNGDFELRGPIISPDRKYLGAYIELKNQETDLVSDSVDSWYRLSIWRIELPYPIILWPKGVLFCDLCDWTIRDKWLFMICSKHRSTAYSLESTMPVPIDITPCISAVDKSFLFCLEVCGPLRDVVCCCSLKSGLFSFFRLLQSSGHSWIAIPLRLSTRNSVLGIQEAALQRLGTVHYIQRVTYNYVLTTTGAVLDLNPCIMEDSSATLFPASHMEGYEVLDLYEIPNSAEVIAIVSISRREDDFAGSLEFVLLCPERKRQLKRTRGPRIPSTSVRTFNFSWDGTRYLSLLGSPASAAGSSFYVPLQVRW